VNPAINLSFRYLERDYVQALRAHYASRLRLAVDIFVILILGGIGVYLWKDWIGILCVVISAGYALVLIAAFTVLPILIFRSQPKFRDDYSLTFSGENIHFQTAHIDSNLQWSLYSHALIDANSYLLYYGWRQFTVIPKRVFQSVEQQQMFEHLLIQQIKKIVRQDR
jgi:hypothetical protein